MTTRWTLFAYKNYGENDSWLYHEFDTPALMVTFTPVHFIFVDVVGDQARAEVTSYFDFDNEKISRFERDYRLTEGAAPANAWNTMRHFLEKIKKL